MYEICSANCKNTLLVENVNELPEWIVTNPDFKVIGVTAGASTPDWVIAEVINKLKSGNAE